MKKSLVIALMLVMAAVPAVRAGTPDYSAFDDVTTAYKRASDSGLSWALTEMVCCNCYKRMPDDTRFYYGVREVESCRSYQGGYCAGYTRCFP